MCAGLGFSAAARRAAEVFALVWAGSQVGQAAAAAAAAAEQHAAHSLLHQQLTTLLPCSEH
jgi:hypothetical protein